MSKYEEVYHRVYIEANHAFEYVVMYVDLGLTEVVKTAEVQFKHLLNYFAEVPCMTIACRLQGVEFKLKNDQIPFETYSELRSLCLGTSFFVEASEQMHNIWNVKIFDVDERSLNDIVVEKGLAVCIIYALLFFNGAVHLFQFSTSLQPKAAISPIVVNQNRDLKSSQCMDDYEVVVDPSTVKVRDSLL